MGSFRPREDDESVALTPDEDGPPPPKILRTAKEASESPDGLSEAATFPSGASNILFPPSSTDVNGEQLEENRESENLLQVGSSKRIGLNPTDLKQYTFFLS